MHHFDTIIKKLISLHKDPNTEYSERAMFPSANDLSFAISRLMDAQNILTSESYENKELPTQLHAQWCSLREQMPSNTANELALCIIKNTPFTNTPEQQQELQGLFYKSLLDFINNAELAQTLCDLFFKESEAKMPKMRDRD